MYGPVPCFLRGTNILTSKGEAHVEDLMIGDLVVTADGEAMPIRWIGRNLFKKAGTRPWPESVQPILVSRFAIDDKTPHADLYLSPGHALYIDGVLIPVKHLINGTSITQAMPEGMDAVEYFQIELETHEVIFAEGTPVESFLVKDGNRENFTNFVEYERLYGTEPALSMTPYAPRRRLRRRSRRVESPASPGRVSLGGHARSYSGRVQPHRCSGRGACCLAKRPIRCLPGNIVREAHSLSASIKPVP